MSLFSDKVLTLKEKRTESPETLCEVARGAKEVRI